MEEDDLLGSLLSVATKELSELQEKFKQKHTKRDVNTNNSDTLLKKTVKSNFSAVHDGNTDSSEDEERRNPEDKIYNECGKEIKRLLVSNTSTSTDQDRSNKEYCATGWNKKPTRDYSLSAPRVVSSSQGDVYTDPVFGLRIINPVISSQQLHERMMGRMVLPFSRIKNFCQKREVSGDFVIAGVVINKSAVKTSQKGTQYSLWFLSDLKGDIKTISLFLFGSAHKQLWKTSTGTVVGILNPSILDKKDGSKDEGCFSIDNPQMAMLLGKSKDFGVCRSKKKNGDPCTAVVNLSRCEFCIYHIQQEYQKCSRRSELQSTFSGKGLTALRNKVLGKDQVFYAGKLYTAIPAKKNRKNIEKDELRLKSLNGLSDMSKNIIKAKNITKKRAAANLDVSLAQRKKDLETLKRLGGKVDHEQSNIKHTALSHSTPACDIVESKNIALDIISKLNEKKINQQKENVEVKTSSLKDAESASRPIINFDHSSAITDKNKVFQNNCVNNNPSNVFPIFQPSSTKVIDLNAPLTSKHINRAKLNAIKYIQKNGPIEKEDPNSIDSRKKKKKKTNGVTKPTEVDAKIQKLQQNEFFSERFKKMMEATSKHTDLLELHDDEEKEKYFRKLEIKEQMQDKMATTYKVACKAVRCLKCKYTNFSAAELCKTEKHPLKVFDAMKRFFKCGNCRNRTVSLEIIPTGFCTNCGSGKWERTGMMEEKIVQARDGLSIRGGEQKHMNSVITDANINLLVPEDGA